MSVEREWGRGRQAEGLERTMLALRDAREPQDVLGIVTRNLARDLRRTCTAYQLREGTFRPVATSDLRRSPVPFSASKIDVPGVRTGGLGRLGTSDILGILSDGKLRAIVIIERGSPTLDEEDARYLRAVGVQASLAITNALAFEQLRRLAAEGAALTAAAKAILGFTELDPLALALCRLCGRLVPAEYVAVYTHRGDSFVRVGDWREYGGIDAPALLPYDAGAARTALDELFGTTPLAVEVLDYGIAHESESRGLLVISRRAAFEKTQLRLIETFVTLASLAIRNTELYEQTMRANQALAESNAFKDDLMAMFAHDFKGPLTVISGFSELLFDSQDPEDVRKSARTIVEQTQRLARLSEDALALANTQSAGFSLERKRADLGAFVIKTVAQFDREERVHVSAPPEPVFATFDRTRLRHVLENVLGNALKYSNGPVYADVAAFADDIVICVADEGIGIPAADLGTIFSRFGRGTNARSSGIAGSGVGLYIAKKIVEVHGGRLEVASVEGKGSTFRIWLPALPV